MSTRDLFAKFGLLDWLVMPETAWHFLFAELCDYGRDLRGDEQTLEMILLVKPRGQA